MARPLLVYFHGVPGSSAELDLIEGADQGCDLFAPDRFAAPSDPDAGVAFDDLSQEIARAYPGRQFILVGFSLGSFVALQVAQRLGARVDGVHLISATAPLECGDFLPLMAGGGVFKTAQASPRLFAVMAGAQSMLARVAPGVLFSALFNTATGADRALASDPAFKARVTAMLRRGLGTGSAQYRREIGAYVRPWSDLLPKITAKTTLWHGEEDNWSPFAMALALEAALPDARLIRLPGCSHYSALLQSFPQLASDYFGAMGRPLVTSFSST